MIGTSPARAADVGQTGRTRRVGPPLPSRAPRFAEDQAALRLAEVHDLQRRVVVDHERVLGRARTSGDNPEDGVGPVAFGAGVPILAGLVEEGVHAVAK